MKKFFLSLTALALSASAYAVDWNNIENVLQGCNVTVSSNFGAAATITDNNTGTSWQATGKLNAQQSDWFLIDMGQSRKISDIEIWWEASHPTKYDIYVSATPIPVIDSQVDLSTDGSNVKETKIIDAAWLAAATPVISREFTPNDGQDAVSFDTPVQGRYLLVYGREYNVNGTNYGSRCWEIKAGDTSSVESVATSISLGIKDGDMLGVGESYDLAPQLLDQIGRPMQGDVTLSVSDNAATFDGNTMTVTAKGPFTLTATSGNVTTTANLFAYNEAEYVCGDALATSDTGNGDSKNLFDGGAKVSQNGAQYVFVEGEPAGEAEHWVLIDLKKPVDIDFIYGAWEGASANKYKYFVGADTENMSEVYSVDENPAVAARKDYIFGKDMKQVRYIKIATTSNGTGYGLKLYEVKVYGSSNYTQVASDIRLEVSLTDNAIVNENIDVNATLLDQYGSAMAGHIYLTAKGGEFSYVDHMDDKPIFHVTEIGETVITATYGDIVREAKINVVTSPERRVNDSKRMKAMFTYTKDDVEVTEEMPGAIDGTSNDNGAEAQFGRGYAKIVIDLAGPHRLELLKLAWETASAADYTIKAYEKPEDAATAQPFFTFNRVGAPANPVDRAAVPADLGIVNYLEIEVTRDALGYNKRLFEISIYGERDVKVVSIDVDPEFSYRGGVEVDKNILFLGEYVNLNATAKDNFGDFIPANELKYFVNGQETTFDNGVFAPTEEGVFNLGVAAGDIKIENDPRLVYTVVDATATVQYKHKGVSLALNNVENLELPHPDAAYRDALMGPENQGHSTFNVNNYDIVVVFAQPVTLSAMQLEWAKAPLSYDITINNYVPISVKNESSASIANRFLMVEPEATQPDKTEEPANVQKREDAQEGEDDVQAPVYTKKTLEVQSIRIHNIVSHEDYDATLRQIKLVHADASLTFEDKSADEMRGEGISGIDTVVVDADALVNVYSATGVVVARDVKAADIVPTLLPGLYIIGNRKVIVK